jgi:hypothetical protein
MQASGTRKEIGQDAHRIGGFVGLRGSMDFVEEREIFKILHSEAAPSNQTLLAKPTELSWLIVFIPLVEATDGSDVSSLTSFEANIQLNTCQ